MSVVLMYHALYRDDDTSAIEQEDLPYAVSERAFSAQLDRLQGKRIGLFDGEPTPDVILTFDDGHHSNLEIAAPLLQERGMSALFFVTSGYIDSRRGFMSSAALHELAQMPGMRIGSHGITHRFFDDLSPEESQQELVHSRERLQEITGQACRCISFPGGRYGKHTIEQLESAGYYQWYGSHVGVIDAQRSLKPSMAPGEREWVQHQRQALPRVAVRNRTQLQEFERMIAPDKHYFRRLKRRSQAKTLARQLMGNRLYHGLYQSLSKR